MPENIPKKEILKRRMDMEKFEETICIDFDGVIHRYSQGWQRGEVYDIPIEGTREAMKYLVNEGYKVVILTARLQPKYKDTEEQKAKMVEWLKENSFFLNKHYHEITNNKPSAIAYIDDQAIRFQNNWDEIIKHFI